MAGPARDDMATLMGGVATRLRQALLAAYGPEVGAEATRIALQNARRDLTRIRAMDAPVRHLFNSARRRARWPSVRSPAWPAVPAPARPWIDPAIPAALRQLPQIQRVLLVLSAGFGWSVGELGDLLGASAEEVQAGLDRGHARLSATTAAKEGGPARPLSDQLAAYAELLDGLTPDVEQLSPALEADVRQPRPRSLWLVMAAVGGALVLVGGGWALLSRDAGSTDSAPGPEAAATPGATLGPVNVRLENPTGVTPAMFSALDNEFTGPGGVDVEHGTVHMVAAAYDDSSHEVIYATSDDGIVFAAASDEPILDLAEAPWAPLSIDRAVPRTLIIAPSGGWQLFFEVTWFDAAANEVRGAVGRVVANDPLAAWIYDAEPVLTRDPDRPWMSRAVTSPSVVRTAQQGFVMLFVGHGDGPALVGLAQSDNGLEWRVRPGPVMGALGNWEDGEVAAVDAIAVGDGFAAFYAAGSLGERGLAVSANGLEWTPHTANPLITSAEVPGAELFDSEFIDTGKDVLAYLENGNGRAGTAISVLRLEVSLAQIIEQLIGD